jgi:DHA1 family bicyclomycin/chloramphenicol resistance-like MFS transporter
LFLAISWWFDGHPPLWLFMSNCFVLFFCIGILFGNLNSIAMEPLGHVAGTAASVIGSATTLLAAGLGFLIGRAYDGSLLPVALGFVSLTTISLLLTTRLESK